LNMGQG
jgi:hypothetical protein